MLTDADGPAARCARLVKIYPSASGETHALRGIEASFPRGALTAVTGPSGSGKSSLLSVLALRERQSGGELWIAGRSAETLTGRALRHLRRYDVAWVAQRPTHSLFDGLVAREQVEQAARLRAADLAECARLLDRLGLSARAGARNRELSGGEQQRLAVAAAVVGAPGLVVADEPTAELDDDTSSLVLAELRRCAQGGSAVVFATHDQRAIAAADRVLHLRYGVVSTEAMAGAQALAQIDSTGRLQLPPEALALFPQGRAQVVLDGLGVRLLPADGRDAPSVPTDERHGR
ncbi:ATP-binding cassette domain-containing protein [Pengzhenrongella frigida]|uniref:ATP-binding cassette domain-containing protein n=1 Tax=Pengzhenrongella frigida TaxID=1259133 RepID=A0A4Q5MVT9_9MICO|nr:ATP-binding cassette domain-containing protein [Cellulomonas sp. HLT2-17]RYV49678.1 ATP-binding cassette domain-containing protein [Cellulomonas sp. HLT2-17]